MRLILFAAWIALTLPSAWAQHMRHIISPSSLARSGARGSRSFAPRARKLADATAVTQAPGVVQLEYLNGTVIAWFVSTGTIPKGSSIALTVAHDNGTEIDGDALNITADVGPGQSYLLPNVNSFGDLWSSGVITYAVFVTINGKDSQAAADFGVGVARSYSDLQSVQPLIASASQSISGSKDVTLAIKGTFTGDAPYVALDDILVPAGAITLSAAEIDVNLSKVPGLDLTAFSEYALTVGQAGWSDTLVYRYIPSAPGTFNLAP